MKNFAGINFRESTFSGDKKGIFSQIWPNFAKFKKFPTRENFFPQGSQKSASKWSKSHGNDIFEIVIFHCFTYSFIESLEIMIASRQEGGQGSKKQVWLISKSNLSCSYYFLRNSKIFVYDENMARQSSGVLLSPIQNIGGKMTKNGHFRQTFSKVLVS